MQNRVEDRGIMRPDTLTVSLLYWYIPSTPANISWGIEHPSCYRMGFDLIGTKGLRKPRFTVDAVYPNSPLPDMNINAKVQLVKALKAAAGAVTGMEIHGLVQDVIDWRIDGD